MLIRLKNRNFAPKILAHCVVCALLTQAAYADVSDAGIQGEVRTGQAAGQIIEATNLNTGRVTSTRTQADGHFILNGLAPGNYSLKLQGTDATQMLTLRVGQTTQVVFDEKNSQTQEVVVTGIVEKASKGGAIGAQISTEQIKNLPQTNRNFLSAADLAPGVAFVQEDDGTSSMRAGASTPASINVFIDGVGQKDYVLQGGVSGQDSSRGDPFPQSAIKEYTVITQNYSAEFDQISSAAVVAVTQSGGNEFKGGVFTDYTTDHWRAQKPREKLDHYKTPSNQYQYGANVSGPIIEDVLHFFVTYEGKNYEDPKEVVPGNGADLNKLPAALRAKIGGEIADFKEDLFFGKLDLTLNEQHSFELTAKYRQETDLAGVGGTNTLEHATDRDNRDVRIALGHKWRSDFFLNELKITHEDTQYNPNPHTDGYGQIYEREEQKELLKVGGGEDFQDKGQKGLGIQEDFTYSGFAGHNIKTGLKYKAVTLHATEQQPYNPQFYYYQGAISQPNRVRFGAPLKNIGNGSVEADNTQWGLYLQDDWRATDALALNLGVRWDYEESDAYLDYLTPAKVVTGINNWDAIKKSDVPINNYVSNGNNRDAFKDAIQPRLGFTYALNDKGFELFGGAGRAYDRNLFDYVQLETTKATYPTYEYRFLAPGVPGACDTLSTNCIAWDNKYYATDNLYALANSDGAGRELYLLPNELKVPYSDQFSLGVRSPAGDWNLQASLAQIYTKDGFAWLLANRRADGNFFNPGKTWGTPWGNGIPGYGNTLIGGSGLETRNRSFYLQADKPRAESNWSLSAAYTYTNAEENRKFAEYFALDYPHFSDYHFLPATSVPEHKWVLAGSYFFPRGFTVSAKWKLESQKPITGIDCRAGWEDCKYASTTPETGELFGFNQFDISLKKTIIDDPRYFGSGVVLRLDILNLANTRNDRGFKDWFGGAGEPKPDNFATSDNTIAGPMRTMKLGLSVDW
ncbi:MAG TPA: TonB-dependent receptor [Cellvibrionaceae bacterium]|nr:TonB-dependent receptor [Cellvibrionaceae bacterium]